MKSLVIIAAVSFLFGFIGLATATQAEAVIVPGPVCEKGLHVGNPHCFKPTPTPCIKVSPSPTVEPSVEVTETPTASPTAELTVVPTVQPQSDHGDGRSDGRESGHVNAPSIPRGAPATGKGR